MDDTTELCSEGRHISRKIGNTARIVVLRSRRITPLLVVATTLLALLGPLQPAGAQSPTCVGRAATNGTTTTFDPQAGTTTITGTDSTDVIIGTSGPDIIYGMDGADFICGIDGDDVVFGGHGNDIIIGNAGNDRLHGGKGHDLIRGNAGNDAVTGGSGDDNITGGQHNDTLVGGPGIDTVSGSEGTDTCKHRQSIDSIHQCESTGGTVTKTPAVSIPAGVSCNQASLVNFYNERLGAESVRLDDVELRLLALINQTRAICGLEPVAFDRAADRQAQAHSSDMLNAKNSGQAVGSWFQHSNRWAGLQARRSVAASGENIAFVYPSLDAVLVHRNLVASGSHLCNLLSPHFDGVGFGVTYFDAGSASGQIVTQIFTGDHQREHTSGSLIVLDNIDRPNSNTINCWG